VLDPSAGSRQIACFSAPYPPYLQISDRPRLNRPCPAKQNTKANSKYPQKETAQFNHDLQADLPVRCEVLFVGQKNITLQIHYEAIQTAG